MSSGRVNRGQESKNIAIDNSRTKYIESVCCTQSFMALFTSSEDGPGELTRPSDLSLTFCATRHSNRSKVHHLRRGCTARLYIIFVDIFLEQSARNGSSTTRLGQTSSEFSVVISAWMHHFVRLVALSVCQSRICIVFQQQLYHFDMTIFHRIQ